MAGWLDLLTATRASAIETECATTGGPCRENLEHSAGLGLAFPLAMSRSLIMIGFVAFAVFGACSDDDSVVEDARASVTPDSDVSAHDAPVPDATPIGACCALNGECTDVTQEACTQANGHSFHPANSCGFQACPDERQGACCDCSEGADPVCMDDTTVDLCGAPHGGEGSKCEDDPCAAICN